MQADPTLHCAAVNGGACFQIWVALHTDPGDSDAGRRPGWLDRYRRHWFISKGRAAVAPVTQARATIRGDLS